MKDRKVTEKILGALLASFHPFHGEKSHSRALCSTKVLQLRVFFLRYFYMKRFSFERAFLWLENKNVYFSKLAVFIQNNEKSRVVNVLTIARVLIFSGPRKLPGSGDIYG